MSCPALVALVALAQNGAAADPPWRPCVARVVDGATHVAVAGAEVWWLDRDELSPEEAQLVRDRELVPEEWIRRLGHHAISDAAGDVALPCSERQRIVVAWHDGKFARFDRGWSLDPSRVVPLELEDDTPQIVRVVDAAGTPQSGVEVAAWCELKIWGNCGPSDDHIWSAPTDATGEVKLPHAKWFFHGGGGRGNPGDQNHVVGLGFPVRTRRWVGPDARTGDPPKIELVAPPLEPLDLELQSDSGERCLDPVWISFQPVVEHDLLFFKWFESDRPIGSWLARDGRLSLRNVERGLPLLVSSAGDEQHGSAWRAVRVPNARSDPARGGRAVRANERWVTLHCRPVDRERRPWAHATLASAIPLQHQQQFLSWFDAFDGSSRVDSDGRFTRSFQPMDSEDWPDGIVGIWLVALCIDDGGLDPALGEQAQIAIPDASKSRLSDFDLGEIELEPPALRVAGRVVDEAGRPLPGVRIAVQSVVATTDAEGRFTMHGDVFEHELAFTSGEPDWRLAAIRVGPDGNLEPPTLPIPLGRTDVELVFVRYGGVRGRVLMPEGMRASDLDVKLRGESSDRIDFCPDRVDFYPDGTFETRVASDVVVIDVHSKADGRWLAGGTALVPKSGLVDDPSLVIDLRPPAKKR